MKRYICLEYYRPSDIKYRCPPYSLCTENATGDIAEGCETYQSIVHAKRHGRQPFLYMSKHNANLAFEDAKHSLVPSDASADSNGYKGPWILTKQQFKHLVAKHHWNIW